MNGERRVQPERNARRKFIHTQPFICVKHQNNPPPNSSRLFTFAALQQPIRRIPQKPGPPFQGFPVFEPTFGDFQRGARAFRVLVRLSAWAGLPGSRRACFSGFARFRVPPPIPHSPDLPLGGHRIDSDALQLRSGTGTRFRNSGAL